MRDGRVRRALKAVARANFHLNVGVHRALLRLRGASAYSLGGECRRCACCCEAPAIRVGPATWYLPTLRRLFLLWQGRVNGFALTESRPRGRVFVFRCTHFDWVTRSCDSYDSRPGMCRDYPRVLLEQPAPRFLPGCGYRALARNAAALRAALEARGLAPQQLERLERDLFLDDRR